MKYNPTKPPIPPLIEDWIKKMRDSKSPMFTRENYYRQLVTLRKVIDDETNKFLVETASDSKKKVRG